MDKDLIECGIFNKKDVAYMESRKFAEIIDKQHGHVIRDIENQVDVFKSMWDKSTTEEIGQSKFGLTSESFLQDSYKNFKEMVDAHFVKSTYKDSQGKTRTSYLLTKDGFTILAFTYKGNDATLFKVKYMKKFNKMEEIIATLQVARHEYLDLTDAVKAVIRPEGVNATKIYADCANILNLIVLGMTAKEFKDLHNIPQKVDSIRPYLNHFQIESIEKMQKIAPGFIYGANGSYNLFKKNLRHYWNIAVLPALAKKHGLDLKASKRDSVTLEFTSEDKYR